MYLSIDLTPKRSSKKTRVANHVFNPRLQEPTFEVQRP